MKKLIILCLCALGLQFQNLEANYYPSYGNDCCSQPSRFRAFGELLYWNAKEEGLDFASIATFGAVPPEAPSLVTYSVDGGNFRPGFRLGLYYQDECSPWDLGGIVTWYYSRQNGHAFDPSGNILDPILLNATSGLFGPTNVGSAHANWNFHFTTFDVEAGYSTYLGSCCEFLLRPHIGIRGAWIHQHLNVRYNNMMLTEPDSSLFDITAFNNFKFDGVGLRGGTDMLWNICGRFGLYGKGGVSLLWGRFKARQTSIYDTPITADDTTSPAGTVRNSDLFVTHQIVPAFDLSAGITWTSDCSMWCFNALEISLGWEFQVWLSQNQLHHILDRSGGNLAYQIQFGGDLSMQGVVARVGTAF